jgi:LuxR family maltose regulon positive regulatory protein
VSLPTTKIELAQLVQTKLHRPQVGDDLVERPHLLARLDQGLSRKLILFSASAGFGKTTLASQWLASRDKPSAWLSLDAGDNHLAQFLRYLVAAVRTRAPQACPTIHSLLAAAELPNVDYLADVLLGDLSALASEWVLVLDDYHVIRSNDVHTLVRYLLRYKPPPLHVVILTRADPPLRLGRLRVEQQITEIRDSDLSFAPAETRAYLQRRLGKPLDEDVVKSLHARTDGWIVGLQLASISMQTEDPRQFLERFHGSDQLLAGYLMEEVLARRPRAVREFLLRTAIVDRFCPPLADVLLADSRTPSSSRATMAHLEARNLFVIPLDDEGTWYRYHDLFRDFLLQRLKHLWDEADLARLHQRASEWFAKEGLIDEALRHALAAGNEARAVELVETHLLPMMDQQFPVPVLERWLGLFSEHAIHAHPGLLLTQAILWVFRWNYAFIPPLLARSEALLKDDGVLSAERRQLLTAELDLMRGLLLYWQGEPQRASVHLQRALDNLPAAVEFARSQAIILLAAAYASSGQPEAGLALLRTALAEATAQQRPTLIIFLGALTVIQLYAGELAEAARTAEQLLTMADRAPEHWQGVGFVDLWRGWAHYFLGAVYYEWNELDAAAQHWRQVEALRYRTNPGAYHDSLVGLALIAQARNAPSEALAQAQAAREFAVESRSPFALALSDALETRLLLLGGKQADALRRSQAINTAVNEAPLFWLELPRQARLRALIAEATAASLAAALALAETCLRQAEDAHNTRQVIAILALQALALNASRRTVEAFRALERALALAEPGGFVRTFLDLGAPMAELLRAFEAERRRSRFFKRLLAAFAGEQSAAQRRALTAHYAKLQTVTPLTPRELELLTLLSQRLSIQEIAEALVISPNTVKRHTHSIYTKLGVRNRREAIARARELDLLP